MTGRIGYASQEWGEALVTVAVAATGDGRWRRLSRAVGPLAEGPDAGWLKGATAGDAMVTCLLPDDQVKVFRTRLPRLRRKEMTRAVTGWVAREEGGSPQDWTLAWRPLRTTDSHEATQEVYLLYTARRDLQARLQRAADWGLQLRSAVPGYLALDQMFRRHGPGAADLRSWNLVFLGRRQQFLGIATGEGLLLTRKLPADLSEGGNPQEYVERLATEVGRSIFFAKQTEHAPEVARIVVCGDPSLAAGLVAGLAEATDVEAVHWRLEDLFLREEGPEGEPDDLIPLAAAALSLEGFDVDLLARQGCPWPGAVARRRLLLGGAAAALALVPVLLAGGWLTGRVQERYLGQAHARLEQAVVRARTAEAAYLAQQVLTSRGQRIRAVTSGVPDLERALLDLARLTPPEVTYRRLKMLEDEDRFVLALEGESVAQTSAAAQQAFLDLLARLAACDFLTAAQEPRQLEIEGSDSRGQRVRKTVFSLEYQLKPAVAGGEG